MRTVGRIGWMRALTKVLTRSRGTPAAAFAMYCSRNVLVDTELLDYTPCPPECGLLRERRPRVDRQPHVLHDDARHRRVVGAGATDRGTDVGDHWLRAVLVGAGANRPVVNRLAGIRIDDGDVGAAGPPFGRPQVPMGRVEVDRGRRAVENARTRVAGDDAIANLAWGGGRAALLDGEPVVVVGDVAEAFLDGHDLRLAAGRGRLDVGHQHRQLTGRERLVHDVTDAARLVVDRRAGGGEGDVATRLADRAAGAQGLAELTGPEV